MTEDDLRDRLRKCVENAGGYNALAKFWGVSPSYLWDAIHARRRAGKKILKAMGLRRITKVTTEIVEEIKYI